MSCVHTARVFARQTLHFDTLVGAADCHTQAPDASVPKATQQLILLPKNNIYAMPRGTWSVSIFFHHVLHAFRQRIKVFPQIIWLLIHQSLWDYLTERGGGGGNK